MGRVGIQARLRRRSRSRRRRMGRSVRADPLPRRTGAPARGAPMARRTRCPLMPVVSQDEWDEVLLAVPRPHVLQSAAWGDIKSRWGWRVSRWRWTEGDRTVAAAQILDR